MIHKVEFSEAAERVDGVINGVSRDVALEHDTEGGMVRGRGRVSVHAANEVPT